MYICIYVFVIIYLYICNIKVYEFISVPNVNIWNNGEV